MKSNQISKRSQISLPVNSILQNNQVKLGISIFVCQYLSEDIDDKYSRSEAFIDLLNHFTKEATFISLYTVVASAEKIINGKSKPDTEESVVIDQSFITSYTELGKRWQWNRTTVSKFLAELVKMGVITCSKQSGKFKIFLNSEIDLTSLAMKRTRS